MARGARPGHRRRRGAPRTPRRTSRQRPQLDPEIEARRRAALAHIGRSAIPRCAPGRPRSTSFDEHAGRGGRAHGPPDGGCARRRPRRDAARRHAPACWSTGPARTRRSSRSSTRGSSGRPTSRRSPRRAASACPASRSTSSGPSTCASRARDEHGEAIADRGLGSRGARDPARDGPPRRRPDPRRASTASSARRRCACCAKGPATRSRAAPEPAERLVRLTAGRVADAHGLLGSSAFAVEVLRALAASPHRPAARRHAARPAEGQGPQGRPAAGRASRRGELGIELLQAASVNDEEALAAIAAREPEAICVCEFGQLIKEPLLSRYLILNVHPSLLPRWRGAAPIERALMAGDTRDRRDDLPDHRGPRLGAGGARAAPEPIQPDDTAGTLSRAARAARRRRCWSRRSTGPRPARSS